jgi:hypothetical protein
MSGLGFSITELIQALLTCNKIVNSFTEKYGNSSTRVRSLAELIASLHERLEEHKEALESKGSTFKDYGSFKLTLEECNYFISKYKVLLEKDRNHPATWLPTAKFAFEDKNIAQLQAKITSQIQLMSMSHMTLSV